MMKALVSTLLTAIFAWLPAFPKAGVEADGVRRPDLQPAYISLDTAFSDRQIHKSLRIHPDKKPDIYMMPYSTTARYENWGRLAGNTALLFGGGITALGVLAILPEDATAWNHRELTSVPFFKRWWMHVEKGPVIDKDNPIFNFVMHPYAGAAYYMSARSQGFNMWGSFLYSAFISTCFWEYGIEAFMEIPSLQDLLITPICGSIIGEGFYRIKREIVNRGYYVMGSRTVGYILAFLVDPVNEFLGYFRGNPAHDFSSVRCSEINYAPWFHKSIYGNEYGFSVKYTF